MRVRPPRGGVLLGGGRPSPALIALARCSVLCSCAEGPRRLASRARHAAPGEGVRRGRLRGSVYVAPVKRRVGREAALLQRGELAGAVEGEGDAAKLGDRGGLRGGGAASSRAILEAVPGGLGRAGPQEAAQIVAITKGILKTFNLKYLVKIILIKELIVVLPVP